PPSAPAASLTLPFMPSTTPLAPDSGPVSLLAISPSLVIRTPQLSRGWMPDAACGQTRRPDQECGDRAAGCDPGTLGNDVAGSSRAADEASCSESVRAAVQRSVRVRIVRYTRRSRSSRDSHLRVRGPERAPPVEDRDGERAGDTSLRSALRQS